MIDNAEVRTRIAPSPTGLFHFGSARTALFNWLFAKKHDGRFILRIEDTDRERSTEEYELDAEGALSWLGLGWDEGPETPDLYGPYRQSERLPIYERFAKKMVEDGFAYYCYCTQEELDKERKELEEKKLPPKYSGRCRNLSKEDADKCKAEGRKPAIRFKVPENKTIKWKDLIHGPMEFDSNLIGDFVIVKPNGDPIFLISNIVDDAEMKISHVVRGDDHLANTPKQLMLADAMNLPVPEYGHLPMILNPDRTKMSKRKNPTSITHDFRDEGYLPEAVINFMAFLGWTPARSASSTADAGGPKINKEFFTLDELVGEFDFSQVGKSPAVFDVEKLNFYNGYYIRQMELGELAKRCLPYMEKASLVKKEDEKLLDVIGLVQERMKKLSEAPALTEFFFKKPEYDAELLIAKKSTKEITLKALEESYKVLTEEVDFTRDSIEQLLRAMAENIGVSAGEVLWPIRVALSGKAASPGTFELISFFGKNETLERIKTAIDMLNSK
ncbi:TPA: glutamate--tRNA ligase [Candidatus Berkelbacteria bacterium]|uniref:Glutamate--tRNA ligase n=1 Tax=Berkelbacteria bacterium GW2011_GWE1_39_12 TaxID=1618337 RepID=A0A0G4B3U9_9BACT|nr:MAG: glutamyl-tRNA synthetase, nondiscriminating glutamyl-tRNA synthetase [Berkelbacteria bacterium GW2011_GWE1_39_12]HBO60688.1 glutamate--tRNA ligase [Candidatus Berkelbacteria bacterium]